MILKFLFKNNFLTAYPNVISLSLFANPEGGLGGLLLNKNKTGNSKRLMKN